MAILPLSLAGAVLRRLKIVDEIPLYAIKQLIASRVVPAD
jgi:hypothetical protein